MSKQKDLARESAKFKSGEIDPDAWKILTEDKPSIFVGYTTDSVETEITKYGIDGERLHVVLA